MKLQPFQYSQIQKIEKLSPGLQEATQLSCLGLPSKYMSTERKTLPLKEKFARNKAPAVFTPL